MHRKLSFRAAPVARLTTSARRALLFGFAVSLSCSLGVLTSTASAQTGIWEPTGSMNTPRFAFTATLLANARVLVAGGALDAAGNIALASAELYDPSTGAWMSTGSMNHARYFHTATLLPDGRVLVAGGDNGQNGGTAIASAEVYDPTTGSWSLADLMGTPRCTHMATVLTAGPLSGMVLVAGGSDGCAGCTPILDSAELYDPSTGAWSPTTSMTTARYWEVTSPSTLPDGSVLVVGGVTCCPYHWLNQAETYNPFTETWVSTSGKNTRAQERTTLMPNGQALVAGGATGTQPNSRNVAAAELFDASTDAWIPTARMSVDRRLGTMTQLSSGRALVAGGHSGSWGGPCVDLSSAELYGSKDGWRFAGNMATARWWHEALLLPDGQVLVAGGRSCAGNVFSSAELYRPDRE